MFVRVKFSPNSPRKSVQIVRSERLGDQIKQIIVRHVGIAIDDQELVLLQNLASSLIPKLEQELTGQLQLPLENNFLQKKGRPKKKDLSSVLSVDQVVLSDLKEEKRLIEGVHEIAGSLFDDLGFSSILKSKKHSKLLKDIVLTRLFDAQSKHRSCQILEESFEKSVSLDAVYRMMDSLQERLPTLQQIVRSATLALFPDPIDVMFFDVTTLYFESTQTDDLRAFGYSKDQKHHLTQVVLALATNAHGLPVGYQLFRGNTAETSTLLQSLEDWKKQGLHVGQVTLVADRGLCSRKNLEALEKANVSYLIGMPLRRCLKHKEQEALLDCDADYRLSAVDSDLVWVQESEWESRRLIVTYSRRRHLKDHKDREKILEKLKEKIGKSGNPKKLVGNQGYLKYIEAEGNPGKFVIDAEKVENDSKWDGLHAVVTNVNDARATELLARYRRLWVIEESFRVTKHSLQMRPIYHFKPERIEAHIGICYLAYALLRQMEYRIKIAQHKMTIPEILRALRGVQASLFRHRKTGALYRMPGKFSNPARTIYKAFGIKRRDFPEIYDPLTEP